MKKEKEGREGSIDRDLDGNGEMKDVQWHKRSMDRHILVLYHVFWALSTQYSKYLMKSDDTQQL